MSKTLAAAGLLAFTALSLAACNQDHPGGAHTAGAGAADHKEVNRGRRFVQTMGCNDCHTPGYSERNGAVPEKQWLTGTDIGWHGPWGTTYAANLRSLVQGMSQDEWIKLLRSGQMRPPMPGYAFKPLSDEELGYIYIYIKSLGAAGGDVPAYLPPGKMPPAPYVDFVLPPPAAAAKH